MKSSKKFILLIISAVLLVSILTYISALANPATVYCEEMNNEFGGYDYEIRSDEQGNQYGVCIVSEEEYEEWDFLEGKVGEDDSYCAKKGYDLKTVNENGNEYAVCIVPKSELIESERKMSTLSSEESGEQEVPMKELMNLDEKVLARGILQYKQSVSQNSEEGKRLISAFEEQRNSVSSIYEQEDYSSWDWRNPPASTQYASSNYYFFDDTSRGWMTSVKNQASCGSCWSFSSHGSVEAKYNIEQNNSRLNPDLSEQNSVSCDHGCYGGYTWPADAGDGCQGDCSTGGYMDLALKFFMNNGTVDESCLAYTSGTTENAGVCSARCSDYQSREWTVGNYTATWPEGGTQLWLTNNQTKQWLIDNGPMIAGMYASELNGSDGIIERCTDDSATPNHAVVLVGFNDTGDDSTSYWIIKNSWGTGWGDDDSGYFKLGFNECNFTSEFEYATNITAPEFKPSITLNSPDDDNQTGNTLISFNFTVLNRVYKNSTCDLIVDNQSVNTTALAQNGTSTIISYNLSIGQHNWSINCWENGLGIVNSSETRTIGDDIAAPVVHLIAPLNNSYSNVNNVSHSFNVTDDYGPANCTMFWSDFSPSNSANWEGVPVDGSEQNAGVLTSSDGPVIWTVNCTDPIGNTGFGETFNYTVDTISPLIDFGNGSTANGTYAQKWIYINISVTEINFNSTTVTLYDSNGQWIERVEELASKTLVHNFTALADGIYYINATTSDLAGNTNKTTTRNFSLMNPPIINVTSPVNNSYHKSPVIFNITLDENGSTCWYSIDGGANKSMSPSTSNRYFNATNSSMSQITHNLTFSCNDTFGNMNSTSSTFTFDTTSPVVTLISPDDGNADYAESESISFKYNVTDAFGIANCSLVIDDTVEHTDTSITNNDDELTINYDELSSAEEYDWTVRCYDYAGNSHTPSEWTIDIQAAEDEDGGGGGSGGSDSNDPVTYKVSNAKLLDGYTRQMIQGDKLNFSVDSINHILTLKSIKGKNATITVASTLQTIIMVIGEEKKLDLTPDNYYDLSVKLVNVTSSTAKITIKSIYELKPVALRSTNSASNLTNSSSGNTESDDGWTNEGLSNIQNLFANMLSNKYVLIGIGVLVIGGLVFLALYIRRMIRQKKGWDK